MNWVTPQVHQRSWLVFLDSVGVGATLADRLRRRGQHVRAVTHQPVSSLTHLDGGYALNARQPEQLHQLIADATSDLTGIINCWPLDIGADADSAEMNDRIGVFTILHLVKAIAASTPCSPACT